MRELVTVSEIDFLEMKQSSNGVMFATMFVKYVDSGCITIHFPLPTGVTDIAMAGNVFFDVGDRDFFHTSALVDDSISVDDMLSATDATATATAIGPIRSFYDICRVAYRWKRTDLVNYWIIDFLNTALCRDLTKRP
jgi:hypothetical protein